MNGNTKQYMEGTLVPEINAVEKRSLTNSFALTQYEFSKYDIYPLQKNVVSLTGKKPESFELNKRWWWSTSYKESVFEYDKDTKRYAYSSSNNTLSYKFGDVKKGAAIIRAKSGKNGSVLGHIFECVDRNGNSLGLYCTANGNLQLNHNGTKFDTGLTFTPDKWHSIGLTFSELEVAESGGSSYFGNTSTSGIINRYLNVRVMLDDQCYTTSIKHDYVASLRTVTIGRPVTSMYSHIFDGLLEMLALGNDFIIQEDFKTIAIKLDCTTRANTFDEFDMLQSTEINKSGVRILANNLTYKSLNKTENGKSYKQLSPIVESEKISIGGAPLTTRTYATDKLGRVTGISDGKFGNHSYEYDCRGFLVKDGNTAYEYDANGNVTKIGDTTLEYDEIVKDKLVKVGDKVVNYDANNPLVPTSYDGNTFTFEGRQLTKIENENKSIAFEYNDQGLRIKKTVTGSGTSTVTKYFYDDNKLVTEISPTHRLDFLYDENDRLYGFVLDKTATYFYVRDTLENILGVIDSAGNLVVQYAYNAWGKIQSITGTLATTVGEYNPFRYKGYHFDSDTGMYYCHTRYYVPEWCRWLCADSIGMLNPTSLFEQNLYFYCNNNPVCYIDPSGHIAVFLIGLIVGAIIGAGIGFGVTAYRDYKDDGEVFNGSIPWYEYVASTVAGGVIGGGLGAGAGYIASSIGASFVAGGLSVSASGIATIGSGAIETIGLLGALGGIYLFAKGFGPRMGHNQHENQMFKEAMRQLNIKSKSDPRWDMLRRAVEREKKKTGRYLNTLKELLEFLRSKL